MPEPVIAAEQTATIESARQAIQKALPRPEQRKAFLQFFGTAIERAATSSMLNWSVTLRPNAIFLNGRWRLTGTRGSRVWVSVRRSSISGELCAKLEQTISGRWKERLNLSRVPDSIVGFVEAGFFLANAELQNAVLEFIDFASTQSKLARWRKSHSEAALDYLSEELGRPLPRPDFSNVSPDDDEMSLLFDQFSREYLHTETGSTHFSRYEQASIEARRNLATIREAESRGEDITDLVLEGLLPHADTTFNRERGAWIHVAPAITKDVKQWFEGAKWVEPEAWPAVARNILTFVVSCVERPDQLDQHCRAFANAPESKGMQAGFLTPVLHALLPDRYTIVNSKVTRTLQHMFGKRISTKIEEYPEVNQEVLGTVESWTELVEAAEELNIGAVDLFDVFCHWLIGVHKIEKRERDTEFWKISPGERGALWDSWREGGFVAIGSGAIGDVSQLDRSQFTARAAAVAAEQEVNAAGMDQVWHFRHIPVGSWVVTNLGTTRILGIGRVTGEYYYVPDDEYGHRLPVEWTDLEEREINQPSWRRTVIRLSPQTFDEVITDSSADEPKAHTAPFTNRTFELLQELEETPKYSVYQANKKDFVEYVESPLQRLLKAVSEKLPARMHETLETSKRLFSRIPKNDYGQGGAWPHYWGAFYPKGRKRPLSPQLFLFLTPHYFSFGLYLVSADEELRSSWADYLRGMSGNERAALIRTLNGFSFGSDESLTDERPIDDVSIWIAEGAEEDLERVGVNLRPEETTTRDFDDLVNEISDAFVRLYDVGSFLFTGGSAPLIADAPAAPLTTPRSPELHPSYPLEQVAAETHLPIATLQQWKRSLERKGQVIFYGPPGTGKTFVAERMAKHMLAGGDGVFELVQFHPAYAYEDFIQGIRPRATGDGVGFELLPGRFLQFCDRAAERAGVSVMIIDEINRANLSRVFGELMYLLEYRDRRVPLAGGNTLRIPENVRIIGTMNTADRSIALVDHALRRRFAFLQLRPEYEVLARYHAGSRFPVRAFIAELERINNEIDPHYQIGISFFLRSDLGSHLEDIWRMEIEPYLEEYFFDQPDKVTRNSWSEMRKRLTGQPTDSTDSTTDRPLDEEESQL
jgi:5-methylcytosine-specific restriction enzyme B